MRVVVGYVATPEGDAAFERALNEAILRQADLTVVGGLGDDSLLKPLAKRCKQSKVKATFDDKDDDRDVGDRLVDASYEDDVELVVIGIKRRSPVGKVLLGSVAQRVLLEGNSAVLAVKAPLSLG